jgi:hypothetical protein
MPEDRNHDRPPLRILQLEDNPADAELNEHILHKATRQQARQHCGRLTASPK